MFFQHENRFRYKFFDIVQFSRSCAPQPTGWRLDYFITEVIFCQALFSKRFERFELGPLQVSRNKPELLGVYWFFSLASQLGLQKSFFCLSAWRSSIIPYTGVDVNTFLQVFSKNFKLLRPGRKSDPSGTATAVPAPLFQGELAVLRALLYYIITLYRERKQKNKLLYPSRQRRCKFRAKNW